MGSPARLAGVAGVTFDFGNTLVPVGRTDLDRVVDGACARLASLTGSTPPAVRVVWEEERERQWREDIPAFRETDLRRRVVRILARLAGVPPPPPDRPWADEAIAARTDAAVVDDVLRVYAEAFALLPPAPAAGRVLERLTRRGYRLAILSNWPLAASIEHYVDARGWTAWLVAVVVSERVGTIKPRRRIFRAAEESLGLGPAALLHVGDDWAADVVGARGAGWRAAYLRRRPDDTPLPTSEPGQPDGADLVIDRLDELLAALPRRSPPGAGRSPPGVGWDPVRA